MKTLVVNRSIMVSIFTVVLLIYGAQGISYGQEVPETVVEFSDRSLAIVVRRTLGLDVAAAVDVLKIPKAQLTKLTTLSAGRSFLEDLGLPVITDLTGLEHATQLRTLYLRGNKVNDIMPLAQLTQLIQIDLWGNRLIDITPLARLTQLRELDLGGPRTGNEIVDITPLAQLTQLTKLNLGSNQISDITPLAQLTRLTELGLGWNKLTDADITPLAQLTRLTELNLGSNQISDLTPLAQLTGLTSLILGGNQVSDLTPLTQLTRLTTLLLEVNQIRDISPIAQLKQLTLLYLSYNRIQDVTPLAQLVSLESLYLSRNQIRDVTPLAELAEASLTTLDLKSNQIRDVSPLAKLTYLEKLSLRDNPITDTSPLSSLLDENPDLDIDIEVVRTEASATDAVLSISPSSVASPAVGEQLELSLKIAGGKAVAGYQATVQFDTTALRYVSSANGDYLPADVFFVPPVVAGNLVKLNAASLAEESKGDGTLATLTFEVITVKASTLILSDVLLSNSAGERSAPQIENAQITEPTGLKEDVNNDSVVNIQDLVLVASNLGKAGQNTADVNGDGVVNIQDLVKVAGALGTSAAAPSLQPQAFEMLTAAEVKQWLLQAQQLNLTDTTSQTGILFLERLLAVLIPKETSLLPNYPNPFNPETWIPYHLAKDANVTLHIYAVNGALVRTLALGHLPAGMYRSRSRAAYWNGRNEFGESVASGIYFYMLTAGDFSATQKMLIQK